MPGPSTLARVLAEWSTALTWDALPPAVRRDVPLWILDHVGLVLAAGDSPPGRAVLAVARAAGGTPESAVVGAPGALPAAWAALAQGALGHTFDFDDTFPESVVHPGSVVASTALAVGQAVGASGAALGVAVAAGYEIAARLGAAAGRGFHARGFQATGVVGPVVAAAVAARLYGCDPGTTAAAMGLAGSMGGGLLEFLADGSWSKRLHPGWAAHGGVVAAQLARHGFPGPASVLEGRHGLFAAFLEPGRAALDRITRGLGAEWLAGSAHAKLYPCAHVIHPFLDAARLVVERDGLRAGDVDAVVCEVAAWQAPIVCEPRAEKIAPATEYQARASLPFAVAALLADGRVDLDTFSAAAIARPELLAVAARVRHRPARESTEASSAFGALVEIHARDGRRLVERVAAARAPAPDAVRAKYRALAGRRLTAARAAALEDLLDRLPGPGPAALVAAAAPP